MYIFLFFYLILLKNFKMFKLTLRIIFFKKIFFSFFHLKLKKNRNNFFILLLLNKWVCKKKSLGPKNKKIPLSELFEYVSYIFLFKIKKNIEYRFFIVDFSGITRQTKKNIKKLIKSFFKIILLKSNEIVFIESTFLNYNGSKKRTKKRKTIRTKKNIKQKWRSYFSYLYFPKKKK